MVEWLYSCNYKESEQDALICQLSWLSVVDLIARIAIPFLIDKKSGCILLNEIRLSSTL